MKSLPEKDFWNEIKRRLTDYKEEPEDDEWKKIAGALAQSRRKDRLGRVSGVLSVAALALFLFLPFPEMQNEPIAGLGIEVERGAGNSMDKDSDSVGLVQKEQEGDGYNETSLVRGIETEVVAQRNTEETQRNTEETQRGTEKMPNYDKVFIAQVSMKEEALESQSEDDGYSGTAISKIISGNEGNVSGKDGYGSSLHGNAASDKGEVAILSGDKAMLKDSLHSRDKKEELPSPSEKTSREEKKRAKVKRPLSLYFLATPSLAYQKIVPERNDAINVRELDSEGIFSSNRMGFSAEAGFQLQVSKNLELYTSLSYYQQQQSVSYAYQSSTQVEIGSTSNDMSYIISPGTGTRTFDYAMRNGGVSAGFLYRWKGDKLMHKVGGGLQYQRGFFQGGDGSYDNSSSTYLNYQLLYRMEFVLNKKVHVFAQPTFTRALVAKETLAEPFDIKPYRAGLGFGLLYRF